MKALILLVLVSSLLGSLAMPALADGPIGDYDLSQLTGKKTFQEKGSCYAHALASLLEVELKQRNLLSYQSNISPESLMFIKQAYPDPNIQSTERLTSDFGKRIFYGIDPFSSVEEQELQGGHSLQVLHILPRSGFCLEGEWRRRDGLYDIGTDSSTHRFYKSINRHVKNHFDHLNETSWSRMNIFYPGLTDSQKIELIQDAVKKGHYDYHRSFIDLFCSYRGKLLVGFDDIAESLTFKTNKIIVDEALRFKKAFIIHYNDAILYGTWAKNMNHASVVVGVETKCEKESCHQYLLIKNSNPAGLPLRMTALNSITLARGWAKYRKKRCYQEGSSPSYCDSRYEQDKSILSAYYKNGLNYIRREIIEDAAEYIGYIRGGTL